MSAGEALYGSSAPVRVGLDELVAHAVLFAPMPRKRAAALVRAVLDRIESHAAAGRVVAIAGFGVFRTSTRKARTVRNPVTKALMQLPEARYLTFRATRRKAVRP